MKLFGLHNFWSATPWRSVIICGLWLEVPSIGCARFQPEVEQIKEAIRLHVPSDICVGVGENVHPNVHLEAPAAEFVAEIDRIVEASGLKRNFDVYSCRGVENAFARATWDESQKCLRRQIIYDPDFLRSLSKKCKTKWATTFVLAHEIAHHLQGHTLYLTEGSKPKKEVEADEFAGFILAKLKASPGECGAVLFEISSFVGSDSHPGFNARGLAMHLGFFNCFLQDNRDDLGDGSPKDYARRIRDLVEISLQDDVVFGRQCRLKKKSLSGEFYSEDMTMAGSCKAFGATHDAAERMGLDENDILAPFRSHDGKSCIGVTAVIRLKPFGEKYAVDLNGAIWEKDPLANKGIGYMKSKGPYGFLATKDTLLDQMKALNELQAWLALHVEKEEQGLRKSK